MRLINLPTTPFAEAWALQREIFDGVVSGEDEDTLLLLEHPHVYTQGRITEKGNLLFTPEMLTTLSAETFEIDRGGDVTYHGPGQLVGYPILNLAHFKEDLGWYLRALEESIIVLLRSYDVRAFRVAGRTGVWVNHRGEDEKICAIGIKASRWCTMHGFAFNVSTDLTYFDHIVPCGIADRKVTSLEQVLGHAIEMEEVRSRYADTFMDVFDIQFTTNNSFEPLHHS